jgi:hypothetical protein
MFVGLGFLILTIFFTKKGILLGKRFVAGAYFLNSNEVFRQKRLKNIFISQISLVMNCFYIETATENSDYAQRRVPRGSETAPFLPRQLLGNRADLILENRSTV